MKHYECHEMHEPGEMCLSHVEAWPAYTRMPDGGTRVPPSGMDPGLLPRAVSAG